MRTELFLSMRFMGEALSALHFVMDLRTHTVGCDAVNIRFNPLYLRQAFLDDPRSLNRTYLHMVLHCLFRHPFSARLYPESVVECERGDKGDGSKCHRPSTDTLHHLKDEVTFRTVPFVTSARLFDLCADIAVESIIDTMHYPAIDRVVSDFREHWYRRLTDAVQVLTAEKLYAHFTAHPLTIDELEQLEAVFHADDHVFWLRDAEDADAQDEAQDSSDVPPLPEALSLRHSDAEGWEKIATKLQAELNTFGREAAEDTGALSKLMRFTYESKTDYREFLKRFTILREEAGIDLDSFDYGFYNYGMELYGDMPLIEENEFREASKIEQLVIAIDTSASCDAVLVQQFLNETAAMLLQKERFFQKVEIHLIECDERVHEDVLITDVDAMKAYADGFQVSGGYGTDFRPVFQYVEDLRREGALHRLKGLVYFTDGFGTYPERPTTYDTAFLFKKDEPMNDAAVPDWAMKIYI